MQLTGSRHFVYAHLSTVFFKYFVNTFNTFKYNYSIENWVCLCWGSLAGARTPAFSGAATEIKMTEGKTV